MSRFAAEIDSGGRTLVTLGAFDELVQLVNGWDPKQPDKMLGRWPWLAASMGEGPSRRGERHE